MLQSPDARLLLTIHSIFLFQFVVDSPFRPSLCGQFDMEAGLILCTLSSSYPLGNSPIISLAKVNDGMDDDDYDNPAPILRQQTEMHLVDSLSGTVE